jgi:predicted Zn-dependent peptidase
MTYRLSRRHLLALGLGAGAAALVPISKPSIALARAPVGHVLPNGLVVVAEERRSADSLAVLLTARAGARDTREVPGLALLVSRTIFQGTGKYPSETDLQRAAALVGGQLRRGTTQETSLFSCVVPAFEADVAFDLLSSLMVDPLLDEGALTRVKRIALQDLAQTKANPSRLVSDLFQASLFNGHPLGTPIIGTTESIAAINAASLSQARERLWRARNLVLTIVGKLSPEEAISYAEEYFGPLPPGAPNERPTVRTPEITSERKVVGEAGQQQVQYRLGYIAPSAKHPDRHAFAILDRIASIVIYDWLRTERGLAYFADSDYTAYSDSGAWVAAANVDPQNVELALNLTTTIVRELREVSWNPAVLDSVKEMLIGRLTLEEETNSARAERLTAHMFGEEPTEEYIQKLRAVTPGDVSRVAQTYLQPDRPTVAIVGPGGGTRAP